MLNWKMSSSAAALSVMAAAAIVQSAEAQVTTGSLRGQVTNEAGESVSGASVRVVHQPSGTTSVAMSGATGLFSAAGLRVGGPYTVSVSGDGFDQIEYTNIFIGLDQAYPLNVTIASERTLETVTVTASQIGTGATFEGLATTLGLEALANVTSIDRDITDAAELDPFATVNIQSGGAKELSIAGANNRYNSLTIDGVPLNDRFGLNSNGYPTQRSPISYDAIESLSIQSAPFGVEYNGFTGGTINAVTKSGTNEFHGSAFYYRTDDSLAGSTTRDTKTNRTFEEDTWGFTLGGPILKDRLFFFAAYDKFEELAALRTGIEGTGAVNEIAISQADADRISTAVRDIWGFDVGGFSKDPVEDEKILGSVDWNINDDHRMKVTYIKTEGSSIIEQNGNNFLQGADVAFSSSWYNRSETVESYVGHLYSDWGPNFSTEAKLSFTDQITGQDSLNGAEFFLGSVRVSPGLEIAFGPDRFRHGNELSQQFMNLKLKGEYLIGNHNLIFGYEREEVDADNLFAQNSEGTYAFASIADLEAATASRVSYNNAVTNNEDDLRAIWGYNYNALYLQDSFDPVPSVTLDLGVRFDYYEGKGSIRENQNFANRFGYLNTTDIDGLSVVLPRLSFKWRAADTLTVRGGLGRFSGGSPNVWVSNSFSNDGVINGSVTLNGPIAVPTTPDPASGNYVPDAALTALSGQAPDGPVNALSPDFKIPTTWKANLGVAYETDLPFLGKDWLLSADLLYNSLGNTPFWFDARCPDPVAVAPDGRGIYDCRNGGPQALVVGSADKGNSTLIALSAKKDWETPVGDLGLFTSYTYADVNDIGYGTASTASSNYSDTALFDFQKPRTGNSNFGVEHLFKIRLDWEKELFEGYATKASLFGTRRPGQPYSYTFEEDNNCVFDVGGGRCPREGAMDDAGHLFYVPTGPDDPRFAATSFGGNAAQQQAFFDYIANSELAQYRGGIAERNGDASRWQTSIDLRLQQQLPGIMKGHKTFLFMDIENLSNLLNSDWGAVERTRYEYERRVASARIVNGQFEYFNLRNPSAIANKEVLNQSFWQMQFGVKYAF